MSWCFTLLNAVSVGWHMVIKLAFRRWSSERTAGRGKRRPRPPLTRFRRGQNIRYTKCFGAAFLNLAVTR